MIGVTIARCLQQILIHKKARSSRALVVECRDANNRNQNANKELSVSTPAKKVYSATIKEIDYGVVRRL